MRRLFVVVVARAGGAAGGARTRQVRPDDGVRAARVDPDPPRPAQPLDHESGRLSDDRHAAHDPARDHGHASRSGPAARQALGEQIYEVAQTQVAEQGLPAKAIGRWFPYVATLMLFIWVVNMLGFIPLPLTGERWHGIPTWGIYAATSSLSVTLALALVTFIFTHVEGIRWNGPVKYFKSWIPEAPKPLLGLIVPLEVLGQFMRLISLSVRLFANMLAGHILILTFIGLLFILQNIFLAVVVVPVAAVFYLFEVVIVVSIQAFIFAALSAIYIGSAIEPEH